MDHRDWAAYAPLRGPCRSGVLDDRYAFNDFYIYPRNDNLGNNEDRRDVAEVDGIVAQALALPLEERKALYAALRGSILPKKVETQTDYLDALCRDVEQISGVQLRDRHRQRGVVEARSAFVYYARDRRGIHLQALGDFLGFNHSTIHYYWKLARIAVSYPRQYEQFTKIYKNLTQWQKKNSKG